MSPPPPRCARSANFLDQVALWQSGDYIRMPLRPETIAAEFTTIMTLGP